MAKEYTLNDLVDDAGTETQDSGGSSGGEWVENIFDKLDEKGLLDQIIEQQMQNNQGGKPPQQSNNRAVDNRTMDQTVDNQANQTNQNNDAEGGVELNAENIKDAMLMIYDHAGQIPMVSDDPKLSELIKLIENNPDTAEQMIDNYKDEIGGDNNDE